MSALTAAGSVRLGVCHLRGDDGGGGTGTAAAAGGGGTGLFRSGLICPRRCLPVFVVVVCCIAVDHVGFRLLLFDCDDVGRTGRADGQFATLGLLFTIFGATTATTGGTEQRAGARWTPGGGGDF